MDSDNLTALYGAMLNSVGVFEPSSDYLFNLLPTSIAEELTETVLLVLRPFFIDGVNIWFSFTVLQLDENVFKNIRYDDGSSLGGSSSGGSSLGGMPIIVSLPSSEKALVLPTTILQEFLYGHLVLYERNGVFFVVSVGKWMSLNDYEKWRLFIEYSPYFTYMHHDGNVYNNEQMKKLGSEDMVFIYEILSNRNRWRFYVSPNTTSSGCYTFYIV